jgi:hypothetical protein
MRSDTFVVDVDGVGSFECRRRTMRVEVARQAEFCRLTEGLQSIPEEFAGVCNFLAYLKVMIAKGPDGWDVDDVDPEDQEQLKKLREVHAAIQTAERRFRAGAKSDGQGSGEVSE